MANPKVCPKLHFYPEDAGQKLEEACQGARWLREMPDEQTTPMARIQGSDYYIHEPAQLRNSSFCVPHCWFQRNGKLVAKCWKMEQMSTSDLSEGWRVIIPAASYEVPADQFVSNLPELQKNATVFGIPDLSLLSGEFVTDLERSHPTVL